MEGGINPDCRTEGGFMEEAAVEFGFFWFVRGGPFSI